MFALIAVLPSCGGGDSPTGPSATEIVFSPAPGALGITALDTLRISVRYGDGSPILAQFYVDEDSITTTSDFQWRAVKLGAVEVKATVNVSTPPVVAVWKLTVSDAGLSPPARVTQLNAGRGSVPGSIGLSWERPESGKNDIDHYMIYFSTSAFGEGTTTQTDSLVVPHDSRVVVQKHLLTGLIERAQYHVRIRLVDLLGRGASLSPEVTSASTGHYRITGRVTRLRDPGGGVEGFPNVLVALGEHRVLTDADGSYDLDGISDTLEDRILIKPSILPDVNEFYWVRGDTMETVDQSFDVLLFRLGAVFIDTPIESFLSRLDFLYEMMGKNKLSKTNVVQKWETYPIPVRVDSFVIDATGVNVGEALLHAVGTWNIVAQEELLVSVLGVPEYGADYLVTDDQPIGGGILGEVTMVDPSQPSCLFQCIPRRVMISLSNQNTLAVMDRVAVHELGHVLWMSHSRNSEHVMSVGVLQSSATVPDPDEVRVARMIKHMPNGTDLNWYIEPEF